MNNMIRFVLVTGVAAWLTAGQAHAQIFHCKGHDGSTSFSATPCMPDKGEAAYIGEIQRTVPESSADVVSRNLRAAEIMRGEPKKSRPAVTVVRDSSKPLSRYEIAELNRQRRKEAGIPEPVRIRTNCNSFGNITNCRSSDGSRTSTYHQGNQSYINGRTADGSPIRGSTTRFGNHSTTTIRE